MKSYHVSNVHWSSVIEEITFVLCCRAEEIKEHGFFKDIDWLMVELLKVKNLTFF